MLGSVACMLMICQWCVDRATDWLSWLHMVPVPDHAGIPPHVDTHSVFMDEIVSLSLGSQVSLCENLHYVPRM